LQGVSSDRHLQPDDRILITKTTKVQRSTKVRGARHPGIPDIRTTNEFAKTRITSTPFTFIEQIISRLLVQPHLCWMPASLRNCLSSNCGVFCLSSDCVAIKPLRSLWPLQRSDLCSVFDARWHFRARFKGGCYNTARFFFLSTSLCCHDIVSNQNNSSRVRLN